MRHAMLDQTWHARRYSRLYRRHRANSSAGAKRSVAQPSLARALEFSGSERSGLRREQPEQDVNFNAIGEIDIFEQIQDAAAETRADLADLSDRSSRF
jgi:hypothetical protein